MKTSHTLRIFAILAIAVGISACKASINAGEGGGGNPPFKPTKFDHAVTGPSLDGTWESGCAEDYWTNGFIMFRIIAQGQDIQRSEFKFSDSQCTVQTGSYARVGLFRYVTAYSNDVFELEYRFNMTNGTYTSADNIRRDGNSLWISDRRIGPAIYPNIELTLMVNP